MSRLSAVRVAVEYPNPGTDHPPERTVVRDFSLELGAGEWVALDGANGCGKTTLLLALAGLWPVGAGALRLDGAPFGPGAPRELRARVGVILQDPSSQLLQPTVREELAFTARNLGVAEDETTRRLGRWVARFGLEDELDRDPQALSAGRQQLVLIAAALVAEPSILLADEPAAHLDAAARSRVLDAMRERVGEGLAVLWATQDPAERTAADRALHLGGDEDGGMPLPSGGPIPPGEPLVEILVGPDPGGDGPRVRTPVPIRIEIAKTGVTSLEGPNGSGKSVVLSAAVSLLRAPQVEVSWRGRPGSPPILASQFPEAEIFEEIVGDEIAYAAVSRGLARSEAVRRAVSLAERLGMGAGFLGRRTWSLSGGEKRIASVIGAAVAPASLLALDEPTAGLDPFRRRALLEVVGEVARERSVLVASQDREWVEALGGRRLELVADGGRSGPSHGRKTD